MVNNSMAVNYSSVAEKVFKVLKGSGLNIQMFDAQDGKELSNPEQSRFFYVADPNLMVNLDDKNQELKVHKGPENIAVLSDLLKSLKNLAKDNLLDFDLREFGREIKPKNYTYRLNSNKVTEEMDTTMENDQDKMNTTANLRDVVSQKLTAPVMMHQRNASQSEFDPAKVTQFRDKDARIAFRLSDLAARAHDDEISVYLARMSDKFSGNDPEGWSSKDERNTDIRVINSILKKIQEPKPVAKAEATNSELPEFSQLEEALNRLTGTDVVVEDNHDTDIKDKEDYMAKKKALQDIQMNPNTHGDEDLKKELMRKKAELDDAAKKMGLKEARVKSWVMDMEEDAREMSKDEFIKKHGESYADIWEKENDPDYEDYQEPYDLPEGQSPAQKAAFQKMLDAKKGKKEEPVEEDAELSILKRNAGLEETKGKDHDGDGDVDSDDYMASKDKAIKKAMSEDKNEVVARMQDLINYRQS
jgi:hypothetical protein